VVSALSFNEFTVAAWALVLLAALLIGFAKTAVGGVAMVSVALFAAVLPAKASTGVVLLLFLVGDVFALRAYATNASWPELRRLAPSAVAGIALGTLFLSLASDLLVRHAIGVVLLVLVLFAVINTVRGREKPPATTPARWVAHGAGSLSGFTSMVANAGGSVMALYLLRLRLPVLTFLGTGAWFFFAVNVIKLPMSIALGLVRSETIVLAIVLVPAVLGGAWIGRAVAHRLSLGAFEWVVLTMTLAAAINLVR
jgi:uncharacterized membrane protein YfcA